MDNTSQLRLVFISGCGPCDRYVIQRMMSHFCVSAIIRPLPARAPGKPRNWRRALENPLQLSGNMINRHWNDHLSRYINRSAARALLPEPDPALAAKIVDIPDWAINGPDAVGTIAAHKPDVIVASTAPLLQQPIIDLARGSCINIHYGITPRYRGEHCLFWPMLAHDYDHLGVTLHAMTPVLDGGMPLAKGYPALDPKDNEASVAIKCSRLTADMLQHLLTDTGGQFTTAHHAAPDPAAVEGTSIRYTDRKPWHNLQYRFRRHLRGQRPPKQPRRIEYLY